MMKKYFRKSAIKFSSSMNLLKIERIFTQGILWKTLKRLSRVSKWQISSWELKNMKSKILIGVIAKKLKKL